MFLTLAGISAVFLIWFFWDLHRREERLRRRVRESFGRVPQAEGIRREIPRWDECDADGCREIDENTWRDLGMDEVFQRVDACQSTLGSAYLYAQLHRPRAEGALLDRERLCEAVGRDPALCMELRLRLARLGHQRGADPAFVFGGSVAELPRPTLYRVSAWLPVAAIPLAFLGPAGAMALIAACCWNVFLYMRAKPVLEGQGTSLGYLVRAVDTARGISALPALGREAPRLCRELRENCAALKGLTGGRMKLTMPHGEAMDTLLEFAFMLTLAPALACLRAQRILVQRRSQALEMCRMLAEVDLACGTASFRKSLPHWCKPGFDREAGMECADMYHPLLERPVPNSAEFSRGALFTGSNASGKSTFLKAAAVNAILAQTLHTCAAGRFALPQAPYPVLASMAVTDDLLAGESYFVAEIGSLKRLVDHAQSGRSGLCVIDEILKGTNTAERVAASAAVLRCLAGTRVLCLAATHDTELPGMLETWFDNYHFCESIEEGGVRFDYRLKKGVCTTRNAIALLAAMGYPLQITEQARRSAERFLQTGQWAGS